MTPRAAITEGFLRRAMRDERYWRPGHPERSDFVSWVTDGFQALEERDGTTGGTVFVRAYTRTVKGKPVHVQAHQRAARPSNAGGPLGEDDGHVPRWPSRDDMSGSLDGFIIPVARRGRQPPEEQRPPPGPPMERVPGQTGKEAASDLPGWARGQPRSQGETPVEYARRLMDNEWGRGNWENDRALRHDFRRIVKFGGRAFRNPVSGGRGRE